jgi:hypothetical protein
MTDNANNNTYARKVIVLAALVGALALVYALSVAFSYGRTAARGSSYSWIDKKALDKADRIEIKGAVGRVTLARVNGVWAAPKDSGDYPVKQERVADFLGLLSAKKSYPVRASSEASFAALGLDEESAYRVTVRGGAGAAGAERPPLLDLLIGSPDATGREVYMRKIGGREARSGDTALTSYVNSPETSWLNLRLFGDTRLTAQSVQRLIVKAPPETAAGEFTLARSGADWTLQSGGAASQGAGALDAPKTESYIRAILEAEAENFNTGDRADDAAFAAGLSAGSLTLELEDGARRVITVGPPGPGGRRDAAVSGSPLVYTLAEWTVNRVFRSPNEFVKQE